MFVCIPAAFILPPIIILWVNYSDSSFATKIKEMDASIKLEEKKYVSGSYENRNYKLEEEMKTYYSNKNYDRRIGKD
jgi:hypothetical protein